MESFGEYYEGTTQILRRQGGTQPILLEGCVDNADLSVAIPCAGGFTAANVNNSDADRLEICRLSMSSNVRVFRIRKAVLALRS